MRSRRVEVSTDHYGKLSRLMFCQNCARIGIDAGQSGSVKVFAKVRLQARLVSSERKLPGWSLRRGGRNAL